MRGARATISPRGLRAAPHVIRLTNGLPAAIDRSVIRGTLTAGPGERRDFHG
jgi:hypothetical protein